MARLWIGLFLSSAVALSTSAAAESISYWDHPRHGSNLVAASVDRALLEQAKQRGLKLLRISPSFWLTKSKDFLLGNADRFTQIKQMDLEELFQILTHAHELGLRVVLTMHSLPGLRRPPDGTTASDTLWRRQKLTDQAIDFWRQVATALKGHPALVGYDLVDEPRPESVADLADPTDPKALVWLDQKRGTTVDLNAFHEWVLRSIRSVDQETPIIVESGFGASPKAFPHLKPFTDSNVLYSFHQLEADQASWERAALKSALAPVIEWQKKNHVPSSRIFVGAFGLPRSLPNAERGLADALSLFKESGWHWTHYAFRDVLWPARGYDLATPLQAPLFDLLLKAL